VERECRGEYLDLRERESKLRADSRKLHNEGLYNLYSSLNTVRFTD
jgi:hypothetical protein